jgi:hypothetical protein
MKIKAITAVKTKEEARQIAIDWQYRQSSLSLSIKDICESAEYFRTLGKKFNLMREFKENCII